MLVVRDDLVFMATENQVLYSNDGGASFERGRGRRLGTHSHLWIASPWPGGNLTLVWV